MLKCANFEFCLVEKIVKACVHFFSYFTKRKSVNNYEKYILFLLVIKRFIFFYFLFFLAQWSMLKMEYLRYNKMASINFQLYFFEYLIKKSLNKSIKIDQVIDQYRKKTSGHIWKPERLVTSSTHFLFFDIMSIKRYWV